MRNAMSERVTDHWHLKREVNIGHILATATLAVGLISYSAAIDRRITRLESTIAAQRDTDTRQDRALENGVRGVSERLDRIDNKLDRLVEARHIAE
jgi:uncharacterized coiled-coil protein SlyX